jgi:glycosyltransferase involved in cell wall biosynthesis
MKSALLIPCHNAAAFLPRLFASARAQTKPFDEIVCYDDASNDDTAAVAAQFGARVLRGAENRGPAHARNSLWRASSADWVHFHDADDFMDPAYHSTVSGFARAGVDVVICSARWVRERDGGVEMEWRYSASQLAADPVGYLLAHPVGGINGYYRREALTRLGGYDESLRIWEDADLHVRLAVAGARFAVCEDILVTAVRRAGGVSAPLAENWRSRLRALGKYAVDLPAAHRPALHPELDATARQLLRAGDSASARQAVALALSLGANPPATGNPLVKLARATLGPLAALRLQNLARRH